MLRCMTAGMTWVWRRWHRERVAADRCLPHDGARRRQVIQDGGMSAKSKVYSSFEDAVRDIPDGATLGFGGFAVVGMPINLYGAVAKQGAKNLTCVSNSTRGGATLPADAPDMSGLIRNDQVKKGICAFTAPTRASQRLILPA